MHAWAFVDFSFLKQKILKERKNYKKEKYINKSNI